MRAAALGRSGLGDATQDQRDARAVSVSAQLVFAYGSAMASSDWARASAYLTALQAFWIDNGYMVKRYAAAHGATAAGIAAVPDELTGGGMLDTPTHIVIVFVLLVAFGTAAQAAATAMPGDAASIGLWFQRQAAPLAAPASEIWGLWNQTRSSSLTTNAIDDAVSAAFAGGAPSVGTPGINPAPPVVNPGTGVAPVPGGLPTVSPTRTLPALSVTGVGSKTPTWVWWLGGAVTVGAVAALGWYVVTKRPDLFRSRARRR